MSPLGAEVRKNALPGETKNYDSSFRSTENKIKQTKQNIPQQQTGFLQYSVSDFHHIPLIKKNKTLTYFSCPPPSNLSSSII